MKKVLIFLGGYLPARHYGGPVTSMKNMIEHLGDDIEFFLVVSNHDLGSSDPLPGISSGWNTVGKAKVLYLYDCEFTKKRFVGILKQCRPDIVYMSSIFYHKMNMPALLAARSLKIPVILCPRGELDQGALCHSRLKKGLYYRILRFLGVYRRIFFHATCEEEANAVHSRLHVPGSRVYMIPNLPASQRSKETIDKRQGTLSVMISSRILPNKNQLLGIQAVSRLSGDIVCDIFGPVQDQEYWASCCKQILEAPANIKFNYKGELSPEEVGTELLRHDCFLLPTAFENYGHAISEAILHDCPVVISRGTTPWDDVQEFGAGFTAPLSSTEAFTDALNCLLQMDSLAYKDLLDRLHIYRDTKIRLSEIKASFISMFDSVSIGNHP